MSRFVSIAFVAVVIAAGAFFLTRSAAPAPQSATADVGAAVAPTSTPPVTDVAETNAPTPAPVEEVVAAPTPTTNVPIVAPAAGVRAVTVTATNFTFDTKALTLRKGEKVRLTFVNSEGFHDFKIDELGVATKKLKAGEKEVVEFTPDQSGTFEAYCSIGAHRAMGMVATVTVQ